MYNAKEAERRESEKGGKEPKIYIEFYDSYTTDIVQLSESKREKQRYEYTRRWAMFLLLLA